MHQRPHAPRAAAILGAALLLLVAVSPLGSHEVPTRVTVVAWVVPADSALRVLVRVPLEAMRDLDFPLRPDSMLDLVRVRPLLPEAARLWIVSSLALWADGMPLQGGRVVAARVSLPDDRSFATLDGARATLGAAPLGNEIAIRWQQALLDVEITYPPTAPAARLSLHPSLAHLGVRTTTVLRVVLPNGAERAFHYTGDPGRVELDPRWTHAAGRFVRAGIQHILGGIDHLLFVLCLVLPVRRWRTLVAIVTAFTLAHSLTLAAAALGLVPTAAWVPSLVETAIAASIIWLAVENVLLTEAQLARRWRLAFGFGLIHGFGFSFALAEQLQFAGAHLLTALAAFNIGVEIGQLLVLAVALALLALLYRAVAVERTHLIVWIGSAFIAHTAYHWLTARGAVLVAYRDALHWPVLDAHFALGAVRVALLASIALALALGFRQILRRVLPE